MTIGERVKSLRMKRNMRQTALAKESGVPVSTINALESGARSGEGLSVATVRKLANALQVTLDYLCGLDEPDSELFPTMAGMA